MIRLHATAGAAMLAASVFVAPIARAATDEQQIVDRAVITINDMRSDKEFGTAPDLMRRARAVLIVPQLFKAGFFFGGEGGSGVLMARGTNGWSDPAFYTIGSASFGLQIGAQSSELVLFIMTDKALNAVLHNEFKLGADAGLTVVTLGSGVSASTAGNPAADIIGWASSSGAYAGISLEGSVLKPRDSYNAAYYGRAATARDIVLRRNVNNHGATRLQQALGTAGS
jgi:lipid-binding SYLF domain-containing protein